MLKTWRLRRTKKLLWRLLFFLNFYYWIWCSFCWYQLVSWVAFNFFLFYIRAETSWFDNSWRFVKIFMWIIDFRLNDFLVFDFNRFSLRIWNNRWFARQRRFCYLLFFSLINIIWVTTFLVWQGWSLSFLFIKTWSFGYLNIFLLISFQLLYFLSYFLNFLLFLDNWSLWLRICENIINFIHLFLFFIIFHHFLQIRHKLLFIFLDSTLFFLITRVSFSLTMVYRLWQYDDRLSFYFILFWNFLFLRNLLFFDDLFLNRIIFGFTIHSFDNFFGINIECLYLNCLFLLFFDGRSWSCYNILFFFCYLFEFLIYYLLDSKVLYFSFYFYILTKLRGLERRLLVVGRLL